MKDEAGVAGAHNPSSGNLWRKELSQDAGKVLRKTQLGTRKGWTCQQINPLGRLVRSRPSPSGGLSLAVTGWTAKAIRRVCPRGMGGASQVTYLLPRGSQRTRVAIRTSATLRAFGAIFSSRTRGADFPLQVRKEKVRENPQSHPPPHDSHGPSGPESPGPG